MDCLVLNCGSSSIKFEVFTTPALQSRLRGEIEATIPLAPLHNPVNLEGIRLARRLWPRAAQIAAFDTAFHQTLPPQAFRYAVPGHWYRAHGVRRYVESAILAIATDEARGIARGMLELLRQPAQKP